MFKSFWDSILIFSLTKFMPQKTITHRKFELFHGTPQDITIYGLTKVTKYYRNNLPKLLLGR